ncbi:hypothetical protein [Streptomyces sp. NPDC018352]|uniref:hypothetical protein n=1 Tax=Streptomyces sp. NPDC018352 TaxID=3157194 RepID=UPI003405F24C
MDRELYLPKPWTDERERCRARRSPTDRQTRRATSTERDAALAPAQRAVAVHVRQQAAMPQEYLEGRTTDGVVDARTGEPPPRRRRPAAPSRRPGQRRQEHQRPGPGQGAQP